MFALHKAVSLVHGLKSHDELNHRQICVVFFFFSNSVYVLVITRTWLASRIDSRFDVVHVSPFCENLKVVSVKCCKKSGFESD